MCLRGGSPKMRQEAEMKWLIVVILSWHLLYAHTCTEIFILLPDWEKQGGGAVLGTFRARRDLHTPTENIGLPSSLFRGFSKLG